MKIGVLGPEGTLSHITAHDIFPDAEVECFLSVDDLFCALSSGKVEKIIAPMHNSVSGYIEETLRHLLKDRLCITAKIEKRIVFHLVGKGKIEEADHLFAYPLSYKQCEEKMNRLCPHCDVIYTKSNSEAIAKVQECSGSALALAIDGHGLDLFEENVQGEDQNVTRFFVLGKEATKDGDHTSLIISNLDSEMQESELKDSFSRNAIKVDEFESIMLDDKIIYWITCIGHFTDEMICELFESLAEHGTVKVLGSYV